MPPPPHAHITPPPPPPPPHVCARYRKQPGPTPLEITHAKLDQAAAELKNTAASMTHFAISLVTLNPKPTPQASCVQMLHFLFSFGFGSWRLREGLGCRFAPPSPVFQLKIAFEL